MSNDFDPDTIESAPLPALPETVEAWIAAVDTADPPLAVQLSRRTANRWTRAASLSPGNDRHGEILATCQRYCVEHGATSWKLSAASTEPIEWTSTVSIEADGGIPVLNLADPAELLRASWELTFRAARVMIDATSVAPRLMNEVASVYREALSTLREVTGTSESATMAHINAEASQKKLDRVIGVLEKLGVDSGSAGGGTTTAAKSVDDGSGSIARRLLAAANADERARILSHEIGQALSIVDSKSDLQALVSRLWAAHADGTLKMSKETLDAAREIVREVNR